jgi:hypothetical protein
MVVRKAISGVLFLALSTTLLGKSIKMTPEGLWGYIRREIAKRRKTLQNSNHSTIRRFQRYFMTLSGGPRSSNFYR